ncbi:hypothetical protein LIER_43995 [Lithospermum erythrorhizon]|uniref:Uncharacterized protein n=1 Tax=Lithospermum erythrorhizon TaxID=34254 RepID=A0AAV3RHC1_LITER
MKEESRLAILTVLKAHIYSLQTGGKRKRAQIETIDGTSSFTKKRRFESLLDEAGTSETQIHNRGISCNMALAQDRGKRIMELSEQDDEDIETAEGNWGQDETQTQQHEVEKPNPATHASFGSFVHKNCSWLISGSFIHKNCSWLINGAHASFGSFIHKNCSWLIL